MKAGEHILNTNNSKDPEVSGSQDLRIQRPVWLNYVDLSRGVIFA